MSTEKLQLLRDFPWDENYPKLVAFTDYILQMKSWNNGIIPKGYNAESIVQEAIIKIFSGKRNWEPERGPLITYLKWVIRSDISHLIKSNTNKLEIHSDIEDEDCEEVTFEDWVDQLALQNSEANSPEELLANSEIEIENIEIARAKIDALLMAANGNSDLEEIVYAVIDGKCSPKPQDLAQFLNKPINKIYQNLKTLRLKANKIRIEDQDEGK